MTRRLEEAVTGQSAVRERVAKLLETLLAELHSRANPDNVAGMARFGISSVGTLGVPMSEVRSIAAQARRELRPYPLEQHELALALWESGVHEARLMAAILERPKFATKQQALQWLADVDSWDTCDQLCQNLLWRTDFAWTLPTEWALLEGGFIKRAAFVVAAQLAAKDKHAPDERFFSLLDLVEQHAEDERNEVKKAVNWALRQIGKRSAPLHESAVATGERILDHARSVRPATPGTRAARWVATDALRELRSPAVLSRLGIG